LRNAEFDVNDEEVDVVLHLKSLASKETKTSMTKMIPISAYSKIIPMVGLIQTMLSYASPGK
jgi:hypothetical protein